MNRSRRAPAPRDSPPPGLPVSSSPASVAGRVGRRKRRSRVWRLAAAISADPALPAESPVVVGDVLLGMPVDRPAVVRKVPVVVVGIVFVEELDPTRGVARRSSEVAIEKAVPIVVARVRVKPI